MHKNQYEDEPLVGVNRLAERYSLSTDTIRKWLRSGVLPGRRINGQWGVAWDAIFAFEGRVASPRGDAREEAKRPFWTVEKVAVFFNREPATVREWFRKGSLDGLKIMGEWYTNTIAIRERLGRSLP
jgi:hypothetical protein